MKKFVLTLGLLVAAMCPGFTQGRGSLTQDYLEFKRPLMNFEDSQLLLFNGRGYASPIQHSMTQFTNVQFLPVQLPWYTFHMNVIDNESGTEIRDDIGGEWKVWQAEGRGFDPLGCNFRPGSYWVMVTQDEKWKPNLYTRTGTFFKEIGENLINLGFESSTCVSSTENDVIIKYSITNRSNEDASLTLKPIHKKLGDNWNLDSRFQVYDKGGYKIEVASDLEKSSADGFIMDIPAGKTVTANFVVTFLTPGQEFKGVHQTNIAQKFDKAQKDIQDRFAWAAEKLPEVYTGVEKVDELYYRSILSVLMCRNDSEAFIINPFWSVGSWPYTISWDNSFASDIISLLEPESLRRTLVLNLGHGKQKKTYIAWDGNFLDILYIQEPFAQQTMIEAYMNETGDTSILTEQAEEHTVYEWMKQWASLLHDQMTGKDGLISIGYSTELIIEIRTDGYNHIVPIVNCLAMDYYDHLAKWAGILGNKKDVAKYTAWKNTLHKAINEKLWNPEEKWFDNLYPDGSKAPVYTYHLLDYLGSENITSEQVNGLVSHMNDNEFLGKYGCYSIAKRDEVHWDRIDNDWGGGGQYAGMPGRIIRNLYGKGNSILAWEILNRYAGYTDFFPYLSQNPAIDAATQDRSSMPVQIAGGAAAESVIFGVFGIKPGLNTLTFQPVFHMGMEHAYLKNYKWRGDVYEVRYKDTDYEIYCNSQLIATRHFGESFMIEK